MVSPIFQKMGQPIVDRFKEASARPAAFEELGHSLQQVRKAVDLYHAKVSHGTSLDISFS